MLYYSNCWWNRVFLEAYQYCSSYQIFVITLIIGFVIFVWVYERSSVYKASASPSISVSENKDVTVTGRLSAPHTDYYFGIASKLLTNTTCECVRCRTHEYRHIVATDDRNMEEPSLLNLPNMIMFRRSKHSIVNSMESNIINDAHHDHDTASLNILSGEIHKTRKELDFKSSNDFIK